MKHVAVYRTGELTNVVGNVRSMRTRRGVLHLVAPDRTLTLIPWIVISRVVVERGAQ